MARYLIDVNLPKRFGVWNGFDCIHMVDVNRRMVDSDIWRLAREQNLVIVSKDTDFSDRMALSTSPPRVVHICLGNMRLRELHACLAEKWPQVVALVDACKLIRVYADRIECLAD